ncbi:MAG: RHS repeat-associated core domain-containing protein [Candidatus Aenigmatarchaeota archaeon]
MGLIKVLNINDSIRYEYYSDGRRKSKIVNGVKISYLYSGDEIIAELDINGNIVKSYENYGLDKKIGFNIDSKKYYFITDNLGSVVKLIDASGNIINSYEYDEFGNVLQKNEQIGNDFLYTAREYDGSGVYYYRNRYYLPEIGRFISADPVASFDNDYSYVKNSPVNYVDPYGSQAGSNDFLNMPPSVPVADNIIVVVSPNTGEVYVVIPQTVQMMGDVKQTQPNDERYDYLHGYKGFYKEMFDNWRENWAYNSDNPYAVFGKGVFVSISELPMQILPFYSAEGLFVNINRAVHHDPCLEWHEIPSSAFWTVTDFLTLGFGVSGGMQTFGKSMEWGAGFPTQVFLQMQKEGITIGKLHLGKMPGKLHFDIIGTQIKGGITYGSLRKPYDIRTFFQTGFNIGTQTPPLSVVSKLADKQNKVVLRQLRDIKSAFPKREGALKYVIDRYSKLGDDFKIPVLREGFPTTRHYNIAPIMTTLHLFTYAVKPNCPPKDPCKNKK